MSKGASLLGYRQGRERNLGSSYFCFGVFFGDYFVVVLFVWVFWGGLFWFLFCLFCFVGVLLSFILVLVFVWVLVFFFNAGLWGGKTKQQETTVHSFNLPIPSVIKLWLQV